MDLVLLSIFVGVSGRFHGRFLSINKRKLTANVIFWCMIPNHSRLEQKVNRIDNKDVLKDLRPCYRHFFNTMIPYLSEHYIYFVTLSIVNHACL